jgi:adenosylcobinamide kinase/adenosylcobinamide-phosphate guanylyltransferase
MTDRVKKHQMQRDVRWQTIEEPVALATCVAEHGPGADLMLIDCLTLWISNLMAKEMDDTSVFKQVDDLCEALNAAPCPVILVTNEVGCGIVPENAVARRFRDLTGWTNQRVAAACHQVIWMVAGIPVGIKGTH